MPPDRDTPATPSRGRWTLGGDASTFEALFGPDGSRDRLDELTTWWGLGVSVGVVLAILAAGDAIPTERRLGVVGITASVGLVLLAVRYSRLNAVSIWFISLAVIGPVGVVLALALVGPSFAAGAAVIPLVGAVAGIGLPRRGTIAIVALTLLAYAVMVSVTDGYARPVTQVTIVSTFTITATSLLIWMVGHVYRLTEELSEANARLGTFVAPQVAAAVRARGELGPHRRQIAVWFVDLRGFTGFTAGAEPEEVVEVLGEYYAAVCDLAVTRGATIGSFSGDGILGYFGDPDPDPDAAPAALRLALDLRTVLDPLTHRWTSQGFTLGYGIGIAYGYATLGTVGYRTRYDYTALGSVVNLAARLCAEAASGEILLDVRAVGAIGSSVVTEPLMLQLKGFPGTTVAHRLVGA